MRDSRTGLFALLLALWLLVMVLLISQLPSGETIPTPSPSPLHEEGDITPTREVNANLATFTPEGN